MKHLKKYESFLLLEGDTYTKVKELNDENIVEETSPPIHRNFDARRDQSSGERLAGELGGLNRSSQHPKNWRLRWEFEGKGRIDVGDRHCDHLASPLLQAAM